MKTRIGDTVYNNKTKLNGIIIGVAEKRAEDFDDNDDFREAGDNLVEIRYENGEIIKEDADVFYAKRYDESPVVRVTTPLLYVNVYLCDKAYGGPEEGGWWFNTWELEKSILCASVEEAKKKCEELEAEYEEENKGRHPPSSVISDGHFSVELDAWPGESGNDYSPWC